MLIPTDESKDTPKCLKSYETKSEISLGQQLRKLGKPDLIQMMIYL